MPRFAAHYPALRCLLHLLKRSDRCSVVLLADFPQAEGGIGPISAFYPADPQTAVLLLDQSNALGPFGAYLTRTLGSGGAVAALVGSLAAWTVAPLLLARTITCRRDV
jgi:hypothetical protein